MQLADLDQFGSVLRCAIDQGGGVNGIEFECPLTDEEVLAVRHYAERATETESRELHDEVRAWVSGAK